MEKLHPGALWPFRLKGFGFAAVPLVVLSSLLFQPLYVTELPPVDVVILVLFISFLFAIMIAEVYARLAYHNWSFEFGSSSLKVEHGIILKVYKSIPYERVQNVDIKRGILARLLGFSILDIQTAGYSSGYGNGRMLPEGRIPALSVVDAEKYREFVLSKISGKGKKQGL